MKQAPADSLRTADLISQRNRAPAFGFLIASYLAGAPPSAGRRGLGASAPCSDTQR